MHSGNFVERSLELHLFFGRIMKEHSLFLEAGFTPADPSFSEKAEFFRCEFEKLLCEAVKLANGIVSQRVLRSQEIVTEFTALAEKQTEHFTGITIDKDITAMELRLRSGCGKCSDNPEMRGRVRKLNQKALSLLEKCRNAHNSTMTANSLQLTQKFRDFKAAGTQGIEQNKIRSVILPLLADHVLREANHYLRLLRS